MHIMVSVVHLIISMVWLEMNGWIIKEKLISIRMEITLLICLLYLVIKIIRMPIMLESGLIGLMKPQVIQLQPKNIVFLFQGVVRRLRYLLQLLIIEKRVYWVMTILINIHCDWILIKKFSLGLKWALLLI